MPFSLQRKRPGVTKKKLTSSGCKKKEKVGDLRFEFLQPPFFLLGSKTFLFRKKKRVCSGLQLPKLKA